MREKFVFIAFCLRIDLQSQYLEAETGRLSSNKPRLHGCNSFWAAWAIKIFQSVVLKDKGSFKKIIVCQ